MTRPLTCSYGVTRQGEYEPCDKPAVALRIPAHDLDGSDLDLREDWETQPYPVCVAHCRVGRMVVLTGE